MGSKVLSKNVSKSRPAIMASKTTARVSMNARKQIDNTFVQGPTFELSRAMKNFREWKYVKDEKIMEHSWFVNDR
jgi:hypothetical protein